MLMVMVMRMRINDDNGNGDDVEDDDDGRRFFVFFNAHLDAPLHRRAPSWLPCPATSSTPSTETLQRSCTTSPKTPPRQVQSCGFRSRGMRVWLTSFLWLPFCGLWFGADQLATHDYQVFTPGKRTCSLLTQQFLFYRRSVLGNRTKRKFASFFFYVLH